MPAETKDAKKPRRETWEDWLPAGAAVSDDLLTRDDLIAALHSIGGDVTADDFRNWQRAGVIPYGTLRWHEETHATRTFYPRLMVQIIAQLRTLQRDGYKLQEIGPRLRSFAFYQSIMNEPSTPEEDHDARLGFETPMNEILKLKPLLVTIAEIHGRHVGRNVTRVEVRLTIDPDDSDNRVSGLAVDVIDESGALFTYSWP